MLVYTTVRISLTLYIKYGRQNFLKKKKKYGRQKKKKNEETVFGVLASL